MEVRITLIGAGAVGKSALTIRYIVGKFIEKYDPTIEDSYKKNIALDGVAYVLDIMDTAGQEDFSSLRDKYMQNGDGFILVYSVTSRASFESAQKLHKTIVRMKSQSNYSLVLCGNKIDLSGERQVPTEEGAKLAESWGKVEFIETSAKTNHNVNECFSALVKLVAEREKGRQPPPQTPTKKTKCTII